MLLYISVLQIVGMLKIIMLKKCKRSSIYFPPLLKFQVVSRLEPIPSAMGRRGGAPWTGPQPIAALTHHATTYYIWLLDINNNHCYTTTYGEMTHDNLFLHQDMHWLANHLCSNYKSCPRVVQFCWISLLSPPADRLTVRLDRVNTFRHLVRKHPHCPLIHEHFCQTPVQFS